MNRGPARIRRQQETAAMSAASPFYAGQYVICVDDSGTLLVTKGGRYRVRNVDRKMLVIARVNRGFVGDQHMRADRFRPVMEGE